jgi:hypothetical protein
VWDWNPRSQCSSLIPSGHCDWPVHLTILYLWNRELRRIFGPKKDTERNRKERGKNKPINIERRHEGKRKMKERKE